MHNTIQNKRTAEQGSALVYILIAIALLAALTFTFMEPSSQQTSSQNTFKVVTELEGQADIIRTAIQECVLNYPSGDTGIDISGSGTDVGARSQYPIKPNSTHYDGPPAAVTGKTAGQLAKDIRCPGHQDGPNPVDHAKIFAGSSGKFMPPPPDLFEDWQYYNGTDGVYFWTQTNKTDAYLQSALAKLDEQYAECEADVIDAVTGGPIDLDSAATAETQCPLGYTCFRVWMIAKASAEYNGDTDGEELAATCP